MNPTLLSLAAILIVVQFKVPRRYAFAPLLIAICHFQNQPVFQLGASFSICKLVILAGLFRASQEQRLAKVGRASLDKMFLIWSAWMGLSGLFHTPPDHNPITIRLSIIFDFWGGYLYARCFLADREDYYRFAKVLAFALVPLAVEAALERVTMRNIYGLFCGGPQDVVYRNGKIRASGPFGHPILMGTFAATSVVMLLPLWLRDKRTLVIGVVAGGGAVLLSASSGPIVTTMSGLLAVALWRWRGSVGKIRALVLTMFVALHLVMEAPVWFLMARIDLAGGSTGWHRAELISVALAHLGEWWLVGTDYTRHWIAYGVPWSQYHIDITNQYLWMGIYGGLLLIMLFCFILRRAFQTLGRGIDKLRAVGGPDEFLLWCLGATLFAHAFTFLSVSYFDQTSIALAVLIGSIPGAALVIPAKLGSNSEKTESDATQVHAAAA